MWIPFQMTRRSGELAGVGGQMGWEWRKAAVGTDHAISRQDTSHTWEIPGPGALHRRCRS